MEWKLDTHKFPSEVVREILTVMLLHNITRQSSPREIAAAEREMEERKLYKPGASTGRIQRALFTLFKSYKCMDSNGHITDFGQSFADEKISIREFCFWIVTNYYHVPQECCPLNLILSFLLISETNGNPDLELKLEYFEAIQKLPSRRELSYEFVVKTLEKPPKGGNQDSAARTCGFDVWTNVLCSSGLFEKVGKTRVCLKSKSLALWLLKQYASFRPTTSTMLKDSIMANISIIPFPNFSELLLEEDVYLNEIAAIVAFLFCDIPVETISKYMSKNISIEAIMASFGVMNLDSVHGFYRDFLGYEGLVGKTLMQEDNPSVSMLGQILFNYDRANVPECPDIPVPPANPLPGGVFTEELPHQRIIYGAPGTGKSHGIRESTEGKNVIRTTFHPESDYSTFVGAYKPTMDEDVGLTEVWKISGDGEHLEASHRAKRGISYSFVPQAFTNAYVEAWKKMNEAEDNAEVEPVYLVIEEINRGNCAQIFGDLFQLLDRNEEGYSDYEIIPDRDLARYLAEEAFAEEDKSRFSKIFSGETLKLPPNLYIWATMNTSDQSLFPMDSAFKRRWDWEYVPIKDSGEGYKIVTGNKRYDWWTFVKTINEKIQEITLSEDKQIGYFFVKVVNKEISADMFVNKVFFYLWNVVFKDCYTDLQFLEKDDGSYLTFADFFDDMDGSIAKLMQNLGVAPEDMSQDSEEV